MTTIEPLKFGCAAQIVTEETDRAPYVPAVLPPYEHHERCGCEKCVRKRDQDRRGVA